MTKSRSFIETGLFKKIVITVLIVLSIIYVYTVIMNVKYTYLPCIQIVEATALIYVGWIISAIRLRYIIKTVYPSRKCSLMKCLSARFLGDLIAKITPSSIGGEPARAYYLSMFTNSDFIENYAITMYEVYYDVVITCIIGALISTFYLPLSIPVMIVSIIVAFLWVLFFRSMNILSKLKPPGFIHRKLLSQPWIKITVDKFVEFRKYYLLTSSKLKFRDKIILWFFTFLVNTTWAISAIPLLQSFIKGDVMTITIHSISAYFMMQAISILPTPGGSGVAEYGLSITLPPEVVVLYRVVYYFSSVIIGLGVLISVLRMLRKQTELDQ
ncbi:MAG: flippase-like domain-containing protein [Desulfurococcaceae archaeon]